MFNLLSLFQTIDKGRQNPNLQAMTPQVAGQTVQVAGTPLGTPAPAMNIAPDAQVLELMNRGAAPQIQQQPMTVDQVANLQIQPVAQQQAATVPQAAAMPAPVLTESQQLRSREQELRDPGRYAEGGKGRNKKWSTLEKVASAGMGALMGFAKGGVGGAVVGALQGGTNRNYSQQMSDQRVLAGLAPQIKSAQENETFDAKMAQQQAATANIYEDNRQRVDEFNQRTADNKAKLAQTASEKARDTFYRNNKNFDPAKATPAQVDLLKQFGQTPESVGKFDFSKPLTKEVNGTTYKYNNSTGAFEETNLPKNGSKELVDFEVQMPGEPKPRTFKVSQDRAAAFTTQMRSAGINADLAEKRFEYQQKNDAENRSAADQRQYRSLDQQTKNKAIDAMKAWRAEKTRNGVEVSDEEAKAHALEIYRLMGGK